VKGDLRARQSNFTGSTGKPLSVTGQETFALRRLGSGESLSNTGDLLGINQSFFSQITWRSVEAMEERGLHHLCWPFTVTEIEEIKSNFEKICGLPNYCGSIDATRTAMTLQQWTDQMVYGLIVRRTTTCSCKQQWTLT
jgi:hypothetical protein